MQMIRRCLIGGTAGMALFIMGCFLEESPSGPDRQQGAALFVYETDFQSGLIEQLTLESGSMSPMEIAVYKDAVVRSHNSMLYVLERMGGDAVVKIDPAKKGDEAVLYQVHLGDDWNPYDMVFVSDEKAYIANQNEPVISIFNPASGTVLGTIKIDRYTFEPDSNTSPYANKMALIGKKLYVALQRRNGWNPGASTLIIAIDTQTDTLIDGDTIACTYGNNADMVAVDGMLYCANPGSVFSVGDGGIEKIDCSTKEVSTIITEATLGGNPNQIVHKKGSRFYVQNYKGWKNVTVVELDAEKGAVVETLSGVKNGYGGCTYDAAEEKLYVGEQDTSGIGIIVYKDNKKIAGPLQSSSTLPPGSMVLIR